jgi:hypothetical protein
MFDACDLPLIAGLGEDSQPLLRDMLGSLLMGEAARHGEPYAGLVLYLLTAYDLRERCRIAQDMIGVRDAGWLAGCGRGLQSMLRQYVDTCGLPDADIERAMELADRLWTALRGHDVTAA